MTAAQTAPGLAPVAASRRYLHPTATYRLQLNREFGFQQARGILPYLRDLGISHVYLSPIFAAAPGSSHGYDVVDHGRINPELGGLAGLYSFGEALLEHDLGCIVDIVPNHVGIAENARWNDVLRHGEASRAAGYFDIDWEAQPHLPRGIVVLPILGKPFGLALEDGEFELVLDAGIPAVRYFDRTLPLSPATIAQVVGLPPVELGAQLTDATALGRLATVTERLPSADPETANGLLDQLGAIVRAEPALKEWLESVLEGLAGVPGDPASFDRLEEILRKQHYRLAYWRVAGEEINYRRFFDVNGLAGIRVEREEVFDEVHRLLLDLVAGGIVTGVRVDHVDGLYAPTEYLQRLSAALERAAGGRLVPIYVEKILAAGERLPDWPVTGTTGYEFAAQVDGLLLDPAAEAQLTATYNAFTGLYEPYREVAYQGRRQVADLSFAGEINVLAIQLHGLAQRDRIHRDETLSAFRRGLRAVLASFPVYRTYLDDPDDEGEILAALRAARRREGAMNETAFDFIEEVLIGRGEVDPEEQQRRLHFRRRFQQVSGPLMAKGAEDTAFFRYSRLLSLNEVGADPAVFGHSPAEVHSWLTERAATFPGAMSAGTTHDTKRSCDVRARLDVLTERPAEWRREVRAWARLNARHRQLLADGPAPDAPAEYYLYQTLAGSLPPEGVTEDYRSRIADHFLKAQREAKSRTSWVYPDEEYEAACRRFVGRLLDPRTGTRFLARLERFVDRLVAPASLNSLTALILRALAPGCPDFYQGEELPFLALTDPDNRRPVDFGYARAELRRLRKASPEDLRSPQARLWLVRKLLQLREHGRPLFHTGGYEPLSASGPLAAHLFAFARRSADQVAVIVVPRLTAGLAQPETAMIPPTAWSDTAIALPAGESRWLNVLTTERHAAGVTIAASEALAVLPFAVLRAER